MPNEPSDMRRVYEAAERLTSVTPDAVVTTAGDIAVATGLAVEDVIFELDRLAVRSVLVVLPFSGSPARTQVRLMIKVPDS